MNDNPVKIGLIGLGFGAGLAETQILNNPDIEKYINIIACCDLDTVRNKNFASKHKIISCNSIEEILNLHELEAVMLMTPPAGRANLIQQCLNKGKHILTTKPFELSSIHARNVLNSARQKKLTVHLNSPASTPSIDLAQIKVWQEKYDLGKPVAGYWETYAQYHEQADGSWLDDFEKCPVAPIFRLGIYGINELLAIMQSPVELVELVTSRIATGRPTPDNAQLLLKFANGAIGAVYAGLCIGDGSLYPASLTIHFENGTICKKQLRSPLDNLGFTALKMNIQTLQNGKIITEKSSLPVADRSGAYQYEKFYSAIRNQISLTEHEVNLIVSGIEVIEKMSKKEKKHECIRN